MSKLQKYERHIYIKTIVTAFLTYLIDKDLKVRYHIL